MKPKSTEKAAKPVKDDNDDLFSDPLFCESGDSDDLFAAPKKPPVRNSLATSSPSQLQDTKPISTKRATKPMEKNDDDLFSDPLFGESGDSDDLFAAPKEQSVKDSLATSSPSQLQDVKPKPTKKMAKPIKKDDDDDRFSDQLFGESGECDDPFAAPKKQPVRDLLSTSSPTQLQDTKCKSTKQTAKPVKKDNDNDLFSESGDSDDLFAAPKKQPDSVRNSLATLSPPHPLDMKPKPTKKMSKSVKKDDDDDHFSDQLFGESGESDDLFVAPKKHPVRDPLSTSSPPQLQDTKCKSTKEAAKPVEKDDDNDFFSGSGDSDDLFAVPKKQPVSCK